MEFPIRIGYRQTSMNTDVYLSGQGINRLVRYPLRFE
jgi:hypothetical protein